MNNTIVLFTTSFPYAGGEQFLENELPFIADRFDQVYIVPKTKSNLRCELPDNVTVIDAFARANKLKWLYLIAALFNPKFYSETQLNLNSLKLQFTWFINALILKRVISDLLKEKDIDLEKTIFYSYWFNYAPLACSLFKKSSPSLKFITRVHRGDLYEDIHKVDRFPYRDRILGNINKVFSISEDGLIHLKRKYPRVNDNVQKIGLSRLGVFESEKGIRSIDKKPKSFKILSCSNMVPVKRVHIIVDTLAEVNKMNLPFKIEWYHIGGGQLFDEIKEHAGRVLGGNIQFNFLGNVLNSDVKKFYRENNMDLFINVSSSEGIPVSIMEAYSFSVPAIATNVGGTSEIVNNRNGFLISIDTNPAEIASIISDYFSDIGQQSIKREAAFQEWNQHYNASINYSNFINEIECL